MKYIKVLFVNNAYNYSGAEIVVERFISHNKKIEPVFIVSHGKTAQWLKGKGYKIFTSPFLKEMERSKNILWVFKFIFFYILSNLHILSLIIKVKPHIIHNINFASAIYSVIPGKVSGIPVIMHLHDIFPINSIEYKTLLLLSKFIDKIICVSMAVQRNIKNKISPRKTVVVYNGLDLENILKLYPSSKRKKNRKKICLIYIGQIIKKKGLHILLRSLINLKEETKKMISLTIIGGTWREKTEYAIYIQELLKDKNLSDIEIKFIGKTNNVFNYLVYSDILVLPSIFEDPLPTVLLEAMSMGVICIASKVGGVPEIIEDKKNGFLVNKGDVENLTKTLEYVIKNYSRLDKIKVKAQNTIKEKFNLKNQVTKINEIYFQLLNKEEK